MSALAFTFAVSTTRIIRDGIARDPQALRDDAELLAERLRHARPGRVALCSSRADVVTVALCACEQADVELLLLRRMPSTDAALAEWAVGALIREDLSIAITPSCASEASEFAILLATSGTTGGPKVARHSPERLLGRIRRPETGGQPPTWLLTYHPATFAGMQVTLTSLMGGGTLVSCEQAAVADLVAVALKYGATHVSATPTFWRAFLMILGADAHRLPLKQATLGGESVDQVIIDRLASTFPGVGIAHIYASTEAGALFAVRDGRAGFPARWLDEPVEDVSLRITDGILEVRSPRAMHGYLGGNAGNALTSDGWLNTRDRVELQGDRVLFRGRQDSVINVGGAKVLPEEVEAVLLRAPGIADVRVSGVSNPVSGQVVCAELVLEPDHDADVTRRQLLALARHELEPYQVPRIVRIVQAIQYSESGKKSRQ